MYYQFCFRSQLPSSKILTEYQDKIQSQSNFFEQQIKLIANRMQLETNKPGEFRQLSPLTETTEPEFAEVVQYVGHSISLTLCTTFSLCVCNNQIIRT